MAVYTSGLVSDWERRYRQRRASTGRSLTSSEVAGITEPMLDVDYRKSLAAEERAQNQNNFNREMSLREQAAKDEASAARLAGFTDIGLGGANIWLATKYLGLLSGKTAGAGMPSLAGHTAALSTPTSFGAAGGGVGSVTGGAAAAPTLATNTSFATPSALTGEMAAAPSLASAGLSAASGAGAVLAGQTLGVPLLESAGVPKPQAKGFASSGALGLIGNTLENKIGGTAGTVAKWAVDPIGSGVQEAKKLFEDLF